MNILFLDWKCFNRNETISVIEELGHHVYCFIHEDYPNSKSDDFEKEFHLFCEKHQIDACFSYNYFSLLASGCHTRNIFYFSFIYDSPCIQLFSYTAMYDTNRIFSFDSAIVERFRNGGLKHIYYMTLPANTKKWNHLATLVHNTNRSVSDLSFVGALYDEQHNLYDDKLHLDNHLYLKGYLNGIMDAQSMIYGYNFIEDMLTPDILASLQSISPYVPNKDSIVSDSYVYAQYFINRKLTQLERRNYLSAIGEQYGSDYRLHLFTLNQESCIPGFQQLGITGYDTEMPYIFHDSKINLNISLRSITNGIPLRCMDILSAGGFLLTNYQADFNMNFIAGEDYDYYENSHSLLNKIDYYLSHDKERLEMAENGYHKASVACNYLTTFQQIFSTMENQN